MSTFITDYFREELSNLSYPTNDIRYSLSYSQGDGMAFYGSIDESDAISLAKRLLKGHERAAAVRAIEKGVEVSIVPNGHALHYAHFNTMNVVVDIADEDELTAYELASIGAFESALDEDVISTSKLLESEGYELIDGTMPKTDNKYVFRTANFKVTITEEEDEFLDISDFDDEIKTDVYKEIVKGESRAVSLKAAVFNCDDVEIGNAYLWQVFLQNKTTKRPYAEFSKCLIADAIADARNFISTVAMAA